TSPAVTTTVSVDSPNPIIRARTTWVPAGTFAMRYSPFAFVPDARLVPATNTRASAMGRWSALETTVARIEPWVCAATRRAAGATIPATAVIRDKARRMVVGLMRLSRHGG